MSLYYKCERCNKSCIKFPIGSYITPLTCNCGFDIDTEITETEYDILLPIVVKYWNRKYNRQDKLKNILRHNKII